jgi:hypothetical protein
LCAAYSAEDQLIMDDDHIRPVAYDVWEREGRPEARDKNYWARARQEMSIEGIALASRRHPPA